MDDFKIEITGTLNTGKSIGEINTAIKGIEKRVNALKLKVQIDDKVLATLKNFSNEMKKLGDVAKQTGKVIESQILPDGTKITRTYFNGIKNEFSEVTKAAKDSSSQQLKSIGNVAKGYDQVIKTIDRYNAASQKLSTTQTVSNDLGTKQRTITANAHGEVVGFTDTNNTQKETKATNDLSNAKQKLNQELVKLSQTGNVTNQQLAQVAQSLNNVKDTPGLEAAKQQYQELADKAKLAEQMAVGRENASIKSSEIEIKNLNSQHKAINDNIISTQKEKAVNEEKTKQMEHQLTLYKQQAQINATNLTRKYGNNVDDASLKNYLSQVNKLSASTPKVEQQMKQLAMSFKQISSSVNAATTHTLSFGQQLKTAFSGISIWGISTSIVYGFVSGVKSAITQIIELNTQMVELQRVSNGNINLEEALASSIDMADRLGNKISEINDGLTTFAKQGFRGEDLNMMTEYATLLSNISDLSVEESASSLTAAMKGFGLEASQVLHVVNALNEVDNNFSVSSKQLSESIMKSAGASNVYGVSLEKLISYVTAVTQISRESGSVVGNSMKSIFSRITSVPAAIESLSAVGVNIRETSGELRRVEDILDSLGSNWKNLTDEQKQNVGINVAGRYQLSRFLILMDQMDVAQSAYATAMDSTNSAYTENEVYLDSYEAKLNKLSNTWTSLITEMEKAVVGDSIDIFTSVLTGLGKGATGTVKTFGLLPPVFALASVATFALSSKFRGLTTSLILSKEGMTRVQIAAGMLKTSLKGLALATGVGLAFGFIGLAVEKLINVYSKYKQAQEDLIKSQQADMDALTVNKEKVDELISSYTAMSKAKSSGEWDTKKEQEYLSIQSELATLYPSLIDSVDANGQQHLVSATQIDKEIEATKNLIAAKNELTIAEAEDSFEDLAKQLKSKEDKIRSLNDQIKDKENKLKNNKPSSLNPLQVERAGEVPYNANILDKQIKETSYKKVALENELIKANAAIQKQVMNIVDSMNNINNIKIDTSLDDQINEIISSLDLSNLNPTQLKEFATGVADAMADMQNALNSKNKGAFQEAFASLQGFMNGLGKNNSSIVDNMTFSFDTLTGTVQITGGAISDLTSDTEDYTTATEEATEATWDSVSASEILMGRTAAQSSAILNAISVLETLAKMHELTAAQQAMQADAIAYLSSMFPNLNGNILTNIDYMKAEANIMAVLNDQSASTADVMMANEYLKTQATIKNTETRIEAYKRELSALSTLLSTQAENITDNEAMRMIGRMGTINQTVAGLSGTKASAVKRSTEITDHFANYSTNKDKSSKDKSSSGSGGKSASEKALDKVKASLDAYEDKVSALDDKIKIKEYEASLIEDKTSAKYRKNLTEQLNLHKQKKTAIANEVSYLEKQLKTNKSITAEQRVELTETLSSKKVVLQELSVTFKDLNEAIVQNKIDEVIENAEVKLANLDYGLALEKEKANLLEEGSEAYIQNLQNQSIWIKNKIKETEAEKVGINNLLKSEKLSAEKKEELRTIYKGLTLSVASLNSELLSLGDTVEDQYDSIADNLIDSLKSYYEQKKQNSADYYNKEKERINKLYDLEMDRISEVYAAKFREIDDAESQDDYDKSLNKMQKEQQELQSKINKQKLDTSVESKAKVLELEQQMADKIDEINKFKHEREIELRKQALTDQQKLDEKAATEAKDTTIDGLDDQAEYWDKYYENLINDERNFAAIRKQVLAGNTADLAKTLSNFGIDVSDNMSSIGTSIQNNLIDKLKEAQKLLEAVSGKSVASVSAPTTPTTTSTPTTTPSTGAPKTGTTTDTGHLRILKDINLWKRDTDGKLEYVRTLKVGESYRVYGQDDKFGGQFNVGDNHWVTNMAGYVKRFNTGGYTANGEGLAYLDKKELILEKDDTKNALEMFKIARKFDFKDILSSVNVMDGFKNLIPKLNYSSLSSPATGGGGSIQINELIHIDKIEKDANFNIDKQLDNALDRLTERMKPFGFIR